MAPHVEAEATSRVFCCVQSGFCYGRPMADLYVPNLKHPPQPTNFLNSGSGSPEGIVFGQQGKTYWDYTNNVLYVKDSSGYGNTGWVQSGSSGGVVGNGQIVDYTSGTPANPVDLDSNAIAYDPTGALPTMVWDKVAHTWN